MKAYQIAVLSSVLLSLFACDKKAYREFPNSRPVLKDQFQVKAPDEKTAGDEEAAKLKECEKVFPVLEDGRLSISDFSFPEETNPCLLAPAAVADGEYKLVDVFTQAMRPEDELKLSLLQHLPEPGVLDATNLDYFFHTEVWGKSSQAEILSEVNVPLKINAAQGMIRFDEARGYAVHFYQHNKQTPFMLEFSTEKSVRGARTHEFLTKNQAEKPQASIFEGEANPMVYEEIGVDGLPMLAQGPNLVKGKVALMTSGRDDLYVVALYSQVAESKNRYFFQLVHRYIR